MKNVFRSAAMTSLFAALAFSTVADAGEGVLVRLLNGKTLAAQVDSQTDDDRLWLRFGTGSTIILRAIDWQDIATIVHAGTAIEREDVKALSTTVEMPRTSTPPTRRRIPGSSDAERARHLLGFRRPITAIDFDAQLANWDRDVEFDGLALRVFPLDGQGRLTTVRGTMEVELLVNRKVSFNDVPHSRGHQPRQLGSWRIAIHTGEVNEDGVRVKLPFQAAHPEFDPKWAPYGLVHIRLVVPGHGVFDHSMDGIRIRPYAPLRDAMERQSGQRFFPTERTGRGRRVH